MNKTPTVTIRRAQAADSPALATFAADAFRITFGHLYTPENLQTHLDKTCSAAFFDAALANNHILLACDGQELIGYAKAGPVELPVDDVPPGAIELHRLYVSARYHGHGVAQDLMQALLQLSALRAAPALYLGVYQDNRRAQRFYMKYGFTVVGAYTYYVGDHADAEFIMRRDQAIEHAATENIEAENVR